MNWLIPVSISEALLVTATLSFPVGARISFTKPPAFLG
jgi:hypothetical protein